MFNPPDEWPIDTERSTGRVSVEMPGAQRLALYPFGETHKRVSTSPIDGM